VFCLCNKLHIFSSTFAIIIEIQALLKEDVHTLLCCYIFFFWGASAQIGPRPPHCGGVQVTHTHINTHPYTHTPTSTHTHTYTHTHTHTYTHQHTQKHTHTHLMRFLRTGDLNGIRTYDPSSIAAADLRLSLHDIRDRLLFHCLILYFYLTNSLHTRVGNLKVATIYVQLIQNRYMFRSFTVLHCSHQHCVQPVAKRCGSRRIPLAASVVLIVRM